MDAEDEGDKNKEGKRVTFSAENSVATFDEKKPASSLRCEKFDALLDSCYSFPEVDDGLVTLIERVCKDNIKLQQKFVLLNGDKAGPAAALNSLYQQVRDFKDAIKELSNLEDFIDILGDEQNEDIFQYDQDYGDIRVLNNEDREDLKKFIRSYHEKIKNPVKKAVYFFNDKEAQDDLLFKLFIQYPAEMKNLIEKISKKDGLLNLKSTQF